MKLNTGAFSTMALQASISARPWAVLLLAMGYFFPKQHQQAADATYRILQQPGQAKQKEKLITLKEGKGL
ncbi:hypothetical protein O5833_27910, partial [Escherichia coli]|nr:hypothetical protein [Escherichia coli]